MSTTAEKSLVAYHGSEELKTRIMAQIQAHRKADEIAHGAYYKVGGDGKLRACAVGCILHDPNGGHAQYETEFGIPALLAHLEDGMFESMPLKGAKEWPARFMGAIRVGADLSLGGIDETREPFSHAESVGGSGSDTSSSGRSYPTATPAEDADPEEPEGDDRPGEGR